MGGMGPHAYGNDAASSNGRYGPMHMEMMPMMEAMPPAAMGGMGPMHMEMMPPAAMGGMDAANDGSNAASSDGRYGCPMME